MVFLFIEIDFSSRDGNAAPAGDLLPSQLFFLENFLARRGAAWMKRTPSGLLSAFEGGEPAQAALELQKEFAGKSWEGSGPARLRMVLHAGRAESSGQSYVGPDVDHAQKLLEAAWDGQVLLTVPAVHFTPLPSGAWLQDLGTHFLKDLSAPDNVYCLRHPDFPEGEFPPLRSLQAYPQNFLPQASPFFGRREELDELAALLAASPGRLVTLAGPGGFGKTRLAFQAAAEAVGKFRDGVYLVPLAPLLSDQLIVSAIAGALGFLFQGPEDPKLQLLNHLKPKEMLLVLDNFEHMIGGADQVEEILGAAPGVKILATSRERLGVGRERVFEVGGLGFPADGGRDRIESYAAIQLFLGGARRTRPGYGIGEGDGPSLARICRLLEGMPLGLELSATWVSTLSLDQIAEKIESSRDFLATSMPHLPPRHRSLRAVFEYSWILLSEAQKKALLDVSVFAGGFTPRAARKVAGATEDVLAALERKSLIRGRSDGRFEIHELLRYYVKERLFKDPLRKERALDAHGAYFSGLLARKEKDLSGPRQRESLEELVLEMGNLRETWKRAAERAEEKWIGRCLDSLFSLFETKGWFQEGREAFGRAAEVLEGKYRGKPLPRAAAVLQSKLLSRWAAFEADLGRTAEARRLYERSLGLLRFASAPGKAGFALAGLGLVAETLGDYRKARDYYERSFRTYRRTGKGSGLTLALNRLGLITARMGNLPRALALIRKSLSYSKKDRDRREMAYSYVLTGDVLYELGKFGEARDFYRKSFDAYLQSGDRRGVAWALRSLGRAAEVTGDFEGARQMYLESLSISKDLGDRRAIAWTDNLLGNVGWATGDYQESERLYNEALALHRQIGDPRGEAWSLELLGNLKLAGRDDVEAEDYYRKAHGLLLEEGMDDANQAWHLYHLGTLASFRGDWKGTRKLLLESLGYFRKIGEIQGKPTVFIHLGETACRLGNLGEAEGYFRKAARIALQARLMPHLVELAAGVAQLLKAQGDEARAIQFLMAALSHPTCRRQTKDRAVSFALEVQSRFRPEEVEGARQWAKTARVDQLLAAWAGVRRPARRSKAVRPRGKMRRKGRRAIKRRK